MRKIVIALCLALVLSTLLGAEGGCQPKEGRTPAPAPADPAPQKTGSGQHVLFWEVDSSARNVAVVIDVTKNGRRVHQELFRRPPQEGFVNYEDGDAVELNVVARIYESPGKLVACTILQDEAKVDSDDATAGDNGRAAILCRWVVRG